MTTFHSRAYDKKRDATPKRRAARNEYSKTEKGKAAHSKAVKLWRQRNKEKLAAHNAVARALKSGKISATSCHICGSLNVEAHHDDYSKPLDVRWLCAFHHNEQHKQDGLP
jgi:hypothetical protein